MAITREEAISKGVLTLPELLDYDPEFLGRRRTQAPDLEPIFDTDKGTVNSRFEDNILLYEVDEDGNVLFGRLHKREKPNVNVALFDSKSRQIGINIQIRRGGGGLFAQPVMGFNLNRVIGKAAAEVESSEAAAIRESLEENGIYAIRSITPLGSIMPNQTSFTSETKIFAIDCDRLNVIDHLDIAEGIRAAIWIPIEELLRRINAGTHEGVRYDNGPLLWTMMRLIAWRPDWFAYILNPLGRKADYS